MHYSYSARKSFLLFSYCALSALPLLLPLFGQPSAGAAHLLAAEALLWVALWAVCERPAYFHWLLLPAFLLWPAELYLVAHFNQGLSAHHLAILAETSPGEALEFMGPQRWWALAVLLAMLAWWGAGLAAARHADMLAWRGRTRWLVLAPVSLVALLALYGYAFGVAGSTPAPAAAQGMPPLPEVVRIAENVPVAPTRPFGLVAQVLDYRKERRQLTQLKASADSFRFHAHQQHADSSPETIVLVVGESSRFDRWRLNGYERDTNPLLARESNLVVLADVASPVAVTRLSVPVLSTRKGSQRSLDSGFDERSFVSAYREAGFRTWWLSNQLKFGTHDTSISVIAEEADQVQHLNAGGYSDTSSFDDILLAPLQRALAHPAPKQLVVLHTLGSHWNYGRRYPAQFDRWQPSLSGIAQPDLTNASTHALASNSYDNSVLYTDWFLAQVIGQLKQSGRRAALVYVSDHGEVLRSEGCRKFLHGQGTRHEYHVPALVWYSDQYRARYPDKVAQLERHRGARIGTPDFFHSLLDLGDIRYPGERRDWSFLDAGFTPRPRPVSTAQGWLDYDAAATEGACQRLVQQGGQNQPAPAKKTG